MRLIDADKELTALKAMNVEGEVFTTAVNFAIATLEDAPTIEPKQGEWIKQDIASYKCSKCGKTQIADDANELNYCCCCGSKNRIKIKRRK